MTSNMRIWVHAGMLAALVVLPAALLSAERRAVLNNGNAAPEAALDGASVEMFAAMKTGDIDVKFFPKDANEARVLVKNNTGKPLSVKLPDAFAAVPVLAQRAAGGNNRAGGGGGNTSTNQSVGGGMGGGGGMMGGMGMGMMSVPPEKVRQFKVATVCLEHGKAEPKPKIPYEIRPLAEVTTNPQIKELLTAFGKGGLDQCATQAAAWHLANDLSWEELASKRIDHLIGPDEPWFHPQELAAGMQIANFARQQAALHAEDSESEKDAAEEAPAEKAAFSRSVESE